MNVIVPVEAKHTPIPVPEPDMTADRLIERAIALRDKLRAQQDEADERGAYSPEVHAAFLAAGFYRVTQPRMFGGYEFDLGTAYRLIVEVARGHPGAGWCLSLGGSHAYVVGSHWPERAQRELFGEDGHFIAPHRPAAMGTLRTVDGGYILNGRWNYCSGIPYATHLLAGATLDSGGTRQVVVPRAAFQMLDDWGGDQTLGLRASGSNSAVGPRRLRPRTHGRATRLAWCQAGRDGARHARHKAARQPDVSRADDGTVSLLIGVRGGRRRMGRAGRVRDADAAQPVAGRSPACCGPTMSTISARSALRCR